MQDIIIEPEEPGIQEELVNWVNEQIKTRNIPIAELARTIGCEQSQMSRSLGGKRKLTYTEVVKISQSLGIAPPHWNNIGVLYPESRFLPLCGNIAASVWRVKGTEMATFLSPIRPIDTGEGNTKKQRCFFVNEGPYSGEYAVCVDVDDINELGDGDIVVAEETRLLPPAPLEISRLALKIIQLTDDRKLLVPMSKDEEEEVLEAPFPGVEIKGLVIGFFRSVR